MKRELVQVEFKEATAKKGWIYRLPPPPNRIIPRRLRPSKVTIILERLSPPEPVPPILEG